MKDISIFFTLYCGINSKQGTILEQWTVPKTRRRISSCNIYRNFLGLILSSHYNIERTELPRMEHLPNKIHPETAESGL